MGNAQPIGHAPRIVDVLTGAAGSRPADRLTVVVELQRDADHLVAGFDQKRRRDRTVDAARHGDDDAGCGAVARDCGRVHARQYRVLRGVLKSSCQHAMPLFRGLRTYSDPSAFGGSLLGKRASAAPGNMGGYTMTRSHDLPGMTNTMRGAVARRPRSSPFSRRHVERYDPRPTLVTVGWRECASVAATRQNNGCSSRA
jgi:hypothetical protein